MVSILFSFVLLAKTAITFDVVMTGKNLTFSKTFPLILKSIPCYCSIIIFRVLAFSLTIAYLRYAAIVPILILFIELLILNYLRFKNQKFTNGYDRWAMIYGCASMNAGALSATSWGEIRAKRMEEDPKKYLEDDQKFIQSSSIVTFVHHYVVLCLIVIVASMYPEYVLDEGHYVVLRFKPGSPEFCWLFGTTFGFGVLSTGLSLMFPPIILSVDVGA
jgi:hypothetical protein